MSTAAPASRFSRTIRDMALSIGVIMVPLVVLMAFCRPAAQDTPTVDPAGVYRSAAAATHYRVRVPKGLPAGWRSTNAALRTDGGVSVRVSYLTPGGHYAQLLQTDRPADLVLPEELGAGICRGITRIGATDWHRYGGRRRGESALVLLEPSVTVIVVGDAPATDLAALAAALA